MERSKIDSRWPNALRWFLVQNLESCTPWHFIKEPAECEFAANTFRREDIHQREVFAFSRRQDCDDFAGIEIKEGKFTEKVFYFHPVFASTATNKDPGNNWNIVCEEYEDVFEFVAKRVVPDMKDWALVEDANDL